MWSLAGSRAVYESAQQRLTVELDRPWNGILQVGFPTLDRSPAWTGGPLLQFLVDDCKLVDAFVRQTVATAVYAPVGDPPIFYRLRWRVLPPDPEESILLGGVELIVAAETNQLDSSPSVVVRSRLPVGPWLNGEGWSLFPCPAAGLSYLEIVHPSNHANSTAQTVAPTNDMELSHHLFPGSLEKGVIRVGRIRGYFVAATENVSPIADRCRDRFLASPPPLT